MIIEGRFHIQTRSGVQKPGITVGYVHGNDKPLLPQMKSEKAAKILYWLFSGTTMNQPQLVTNIPNRRG